MPAKIEITDIMRASVIEALKDGKKPTEIANSIAMNARTFRRYFSEEIKAHSTGNTKYRRSPKDVRIVTGLIGLGATKSYIAKCLGVTVKTLTEHYEQEFIQTHASTRAKVFNSLITLATKKDPNFKAIELYLKCQEGWVEKQKQVKKTPDKASSKKDQQKIDAHEVAKDGLYSVPKTPPGLRVVGGDQ